jgi:hypothetical protein
MAVHSNDVTAEARRSTAASGTEMSGFAKAMRGIAMAMRRQERRRHSLASMATAKFGTESKGIELR